MSAAAASQLDQPQGLLHFLGGGAAQAAVTQLPGSSCPGQLQARRGPSASESLSALLASEDVGRAGHAASFLSVSGDFPTSAVPLLSRRRGGLVAAEANARLPPPQVGFDSRNRIAEGHPHRDTAFFPAVVPSPAGSSHRTFPSAPPASFRHNREEYDEGQEAASSAAAADKEIRRIIERSNKAAADALSAAQVAVWTELIAAVGTMGGIITTWIGWKMDDAQLPSDLQVPAPPPETSTLPPQLRRPPPEREPGAPAAPPAATERAAERAAAAPPPAPAASGARLPEPSPGASAAAAAAGAAAAAAALNRGPTTGKGTSQPGVSPESSSATPAPRTRTQSPGKGGGKSTAARATQRADSKAAAALRTSPADTAAAQTTPAASAPSSLSAAADRASPADPAPAQTTPGGSVASSPSVSALRTPFADPTVPAQTTPAASEPSSSGQSQPLLSPGVERAQSVSPSGSAHSEESHQF